MAVTIFQAIQQGLLTGPACWFPPNVPLTRTRSGRAWRCDTGEHRYHRDDQEASYCAFAALPMTHLDAPARIRDAEIQQGLDRAHARLLDLLSHPEKIEGLPDAEEADLWDRLDTCCEPCPRCQHSSCDHMTSGCEWQGEGGLVCPCKASMREAKDAYSALGDANG
jgi:hypothetical protein